MPDFVQREENQPGVSWGKVIAGAAVATGAVVFGVALVDNEVPILSQVYEQLELVVKGMFAAAPEATQTASQTTNAAEAAAKAAEPGMLDNFSESIAKLFENHSQAIAGAALLGGGATYMAAHNANQQQLEPASAPGHDVQALKMGYAAQEQMRAVNALMHARMAATSPEYAAQQQGMER